MTAEDSATAMNSDPTVGSSTKVPEGVAGAPNEAALLALIERTGYTMVQENGQRKYGGPPPGWEGPHPQRGCEVFVGKIPRDVYEDELVPVFETVGRIYELRLMMDFDGKNRGYAFVMYCHKHEAKRAVRELNNYEIRPGRLLGVCCSVDNCRLFIGGIPKMKKRGEILEEIAKVTEGVLNVIVYASAADKMKNRGFAFVEYESHRAAAMARRKLMPGRIQLWGHQIAVDWAEPEIDVDEDVMQTVKILYVRNLMIETTEETIKKSFGQFNPGCVERVKKIRDYAFVHFTSREDAVHAMNNLNGTELEGSCLEVTLAKPVDKEQYSRYQKAAKGGGGSAEAVAQQPSYVYSCDPYTLAYYGYPYNALIGPNRDYFVKTGSIRGRGRGAAGNRTPGPRGSYLGGYSAGRGIYSRYHEGKGKQQEKGYELVPNLEISPVNPVAIKPGTVAIPAIGAQYSMFQAAPAPKIIEDGKIHILISPQHTYFINCGDSRGLLCRNRKVHFFTQDHKPSNPLEKERIQNAGGSVMIQRVNGSLAVSRALGDFDYKCVHGKGPTEQLVSPEPEVHDIERSEEDDQFIILACDGIWDVMGNEELCDFVRSRLEVTDDLEKVCNEVVDTCLYKGSRDNMSVILICFPSAPKVSAEAVKKEAELDKYLRRHPRLRLHSGQG